MELHHDHNNTEMQHEDFVYFILGILSGGTYMVLNIEASMLGSLIIAFMTGAAGYLGKLGIMAIVEKIKKSKK